MRNELEFIDAILNADDRRLTTLLQSSSDSDVLATSIENPHPTNHSIGYGMTLLQLASFRRREGGCPSAVLLKHGAAVDLHSACGLGMLERIHELLEAEPHGVSKQVDSYFPIQFAITAGQPAVIRCLVEHGDDVHRDLRKVAYFGWEDEARGQTYTPWKPIHMASLWGFDSTRVPVAQTLAEAGANLIAVSPLDGFRPIHLVAMPNRVEMIRFFVVQGVDVDSRTEACEAINLSDQKGPIEGFSCTPLMVAAAEGFVEATTCLLELGADRAAVNDRGQTALDFAKKRFWDGQPYEKVIEVLTNR